jgi:hypothetical protein
MANSLAFALLEVAFVFVAVLVEKATCSLHFPILKGTFVDFAVWSFQLSDTHYSSSLKLSLPL